MNEPNGYQFAAAFTVVIFLIVVFGLGFGFGRF